MILQVKNICKHFDQGKATIKAIDNISFELKEKQSLAIVGPSGSGKTSLLSLVAGIDRPTLGEIVLSGVNLNSLNEKQLTEFRARHIGIVFQQFYLMPYLTALENVSLPLDIQGHTQSADSATAYLDKVGLGDRLHHFPHQLSGGECQRVAIARASVVQPKILLADEPSGNLDTNTGAKVMDLLFDMVKQNGMTLLLITHDPSLAQRCSQQLHLVGGTLR